MRYLFTILMISFLAVTSLYAQEADEQNTQLSAIKDKFLTIEKELAAQDKEATRILGLGLPDKALRADLKTIVENVITLQKQLKDLGQDLKILTENMNINPLKPFKIIIHKAAKDAPPLTTSLQAGEILYFTVDMAATKDEDTETRLAWSIMTPDGKLSETLKKTESIPLKDTAGIHSFGINTTGLEDGHYTVMLEHTIVEKPEFKFASKARFDIGTATEIEIVRLVVDDEKTGDIHQSILADDAVAYLFSYYKTPADVSALTASYRVRDMTTGKYIFKKKGRRKNKEDADMQRVGIRLDPEVTPLVVGHEYRFDISFADDLRPDVTDKPYDTARDTITFFYGNEPKYVKLDRFVVGVDEEAKTYSKDIPLLTTPLYINAWIKAAKSIDEITVNIRLIKTKDKSVVFEKIVSKANNREEDLNHLSFPVAADLLIAGAKYRHEITVTVDGLAPVTSRGSFTYAKKPPVDLRQYVKVSGVIKTPGLPDVIINPDSGILYKFRQNSTIIFTVPAVYPDGIDGKLRWKCRSCFGAKPPTIILDGSNNNWGFSYDAEKARRGINVELYHRNPQAGKVKLYSIRLVKEDPFYLRLFTSNNSRYNCSSKTANNSQCQIEKNISNFSDTDNIGIMLRANSHATNVTANVSVTLGGINGETIFNESKSLSLSAGKEVEWLWDIDPDKFIVDFEEKFPSISEKDLKRTAYINVSVKDNSSFETKKVRSFTREIFVINDKKYYKDGPNNFENPLFSTIIPPTGMKGPYKTTITGISAYYMDGLKWYYDPEKLEPWIVEVGAKKYKETKDRIYYRKKVPLLITIEDSTGKKAMAFWKNFTYSVNIWKEKEEKPEDE